MLAAERALYIIDKLNKRGILSLKEAIEELGVSESTIRRDFEKLEQKGVLVRINGGVAMEETLSFSINNSVDSFELTMDQKRSLNKGSKEKVAKFAANQVKDGEDIYLDGGTTLVPLFKILVQRPVRIVTNSVLSLKKIIKPVASIHLLGGFYLPAYGMCIGPNTSAFLEKFQFDKAFFGCTSINLKNRFCYCAETDTLAIKQMAMKLATASYLLINSSKLSMIGLYHWASLDSFEAIYCNEFTYPESEELPDNLIMVS